MPAPCLKSCPGSRSRLVIATCFSGTDTFSQVELCVWGSHCRRSDLADGPGVRSTPKLGEGLQFNFWVIWEDFYFSHTGCFS